MGKFERKIKRAVLRGLINLLVWFLLIPFKLLKWIFSRGSKKYVNSRGYVVLKDVNELEHRSIAMQLIGRKLYQNEVIHHINGKKIDNAINNLCLMDRENHEHFHSWLKWKKEKSGKYPPISYQKRILQDKYGGTLLEKVMSSKPKFQKKESIQYEVQGTPEVKSFPVRRNKVSKKIFLEFDEEVLISPEGRIVEIDDERFEVLEEVAQSELTKKQIEIYKNKLKSNELRLVSDYNRLSFQKQLIIELKKERLRLARENKVPAYLIFHDATLIEMAEVMPESEELMLQIRGVGPEKMEKYGRKFINVIKAFKAS